MSRWNRNRAKRRRLIGYTTWRDRAAHWIVIYLSLVRLPVASSMRRHALRLFVECFQHFRRLQNRVTR